MAAISPENHKLMADIGRRLDQLSVGPTHRKVIVVIGLGLFFEVYEIFLSRHRQHRPEDAVRRGWHRTQAAYGVVVPGHVRRCGAAGAACRPDRAPTRVHVQPHLVLGLDADRAFSPDPWFLVATRFLAGVGVGGEYPVADAYLSDVLPKDDRGRLASWAYTWSFVAVPFIGFLSLGLNGHSVFGVPGWRILLLIGAMGAAFVAVLRRGLPESPRWLAGVGRADEAHAALRTFEAGSENRPADADTVAPPQGPGHGAVATSPWMRLSMSPYRERMAMLSVFHLFQSFGYYGFGTLAALVLLSRGYDVTSSLLFTALSFIGYPVGSALAIPLLKRVERKFLLIGTTGALAVFGLLFADHGQHRPHRRLRLHDDV